MGTPGNIVTAAQQVINRTPELRNFLQRGFIGQVPKIPEVKVSGVPTVIPSRTFENIFTGERIRAAKAPSGVFKEIQVTPKGIKAGDVFRVGASKFVVPPTTPIPGVKDTNFLMRLGKVFPLGLGVPGVPGTTKARPLREVITKPVFKFLEKEIGVSKEDISRVSTLSDRSIDKQFKWLSEGARDKLKDFSKYQRGLFTSVLEDIEEKPEELVATTAAFFLLPGLTAAGAKLPIVKSVLNKVPNVIKKQGFNAFSKALGTLYLTSAGLRIAGEPSAEERGRKTGKILVSEVAPFIIGTRLGVKGLLKKELRKEIDITLERLPKEKRVAFEEYMKQAEVLGRFEPKTKNIKLDNIESIPNKKAQQEVRNFLRANKDEVIVGGSVAQTGQVNVQRKLGDMDLYLEGRLTPTQAAKQLADKLKKIGISRVSAIRGEVTIEGTKAIEFHKMDRILTNIKQVIPSWQNPRKYLIKTPEGIIIQRIGLQARRKLIAAFADPKRFKSGKYTKDLKDFKNIADTLFKKAELNARKAFFFRESRIKQLEKTFGKKISRKEVPIPTLKKKEIKPSLFRKPPIIESIEKRVKKPFEKEVKKIPPPKIFKKKEFIKLSERGESPLIQRTKIKAKTVKSGKNIFE